MRSQFAQSATRLRFAVLIAKNAIKIYETDDVKLFLFEKLFVRFATLSTPGSYINNCLGRTFMLNNYKLTYLCILYQTDHQFVSVYYLL